MGAPFISVIIPTRDRPVQLVQAVESVLAQTYRSFEIVVVDDGSSADIRQVLSSYLSDTIRLVVHEEPRGACAARNTGLHHSRGEYIAFLDDDDWWVPRKLELQLLLFSRNDLSNLALVGCGFMYEADGVTVETRLASKPAEPLRELLATNWIGGSSLPLISRDKLFKVGLFDESFQSCQDWDLWIRLCQKYDVAVVEQPLVCRVIHPVQISGDLKRKIEGRKSLVMKFQRLFDEHPAALTAQLRRLGTLELLSGNLLDAGEYYRLSLRLTPTDLRSWMGLVMLRFPESARNKILHSFALDRIGNHVLYY